MQTKRIYKRAMAEFLIDNGCTLVRRVNDELNPRRFNWIFVNDLKLQETMQAFPHRQET